MEEKLEQVTIDESNTVKLKPCPFCGVDVIIIFRSASKMSMVYHKDAGRACPIVGPFKIPFIRARTLQEAAEAWNRRIWNDERNDEMMS